MRRAFLFCAFLSLPGAAHAAAWTQAEDRWQVIAGFIFSDADRSFDDAGHPGTPTLFERALLQTDTEYGWSDRLTLFVRTETAYAHGRDGTAPPVTALSNAFEGGARYRFFESLGLVSDYDVLSIEGSARTAGAFNFAVSANASAAGEDGGFRLLYGSGFRAWDRDGFVNLEAGERWLSHPRPDQTPIDLTAGLWLNKSWMVMAQSFNLISGAATAPYNSFRSHKLEVSGVWKISELFSLQAGTFFSPAGRNALDERGLCLSLWSNF